MERLELKDKKTVVINQDYLGCISELQLSFNIWPQIYLRVKILTLQCSYTLEQVNFGCKKFNEPDVLFKSNTLGWVVGCWLKRKWNEKVLLSAEDYH